jgi:hypothetical protein
VIDMNFEVFEIKSEPLEHQPMYNYRDPRTRKWKGLDEFEAIISHLPLRDLPHVELWTDTGLACDWDMLPGDGTGSLLSERLYEVFREYAGRCFQYFPVNVDGYPFFIPIRWEPVDCLDYERSQFKYYPHDPSQIMFITKYVFHSDLLSDPQVFCIPEQHRYKLCVTSGAKAAIEAIGARNVEFPLLDSVGLDHSNQGNEGRLHDGDSISRTAKPSRLEKEIIVASTTEEPPAETILQGLAGAAGEGAILVGVSTDDEPLTIVQAIQQYLVAREKQEGDRTLVGDASGTAWSDEVLQLGSLWGEAMVRHFGWLWTQLTQSPQGNNKTIAIVNEDRSLAIYPFHYCQGCLEAKAYPTILLAFNMLDAGAIPPQPPGAFVNVMDGVRHIVPPA